MSRGHRKVRVGAAGALVAGLLAGPVGLADESEYLIIFGAGTAGAWRTEVTVASRLPTESTVIVSRTPTQLCPPDTPCHEIAEIPPEGTVVVETPPVGGIGVVYVATIDDPVAPAVIARAHVPGSAAPSVDLPVLRVATVLATNPMVLTFPGATRGAASRANLLLANVADPNVFDGEAVQLRIDVLDERGLLVGTSYLDLDYGQSRFLADIVGLSGVGSLEVGKVRVTKIGGSGVFWGVMPITRDDGSMSASVGATP